MVKFGRITALTTALLLAVFPYAQSVDNEGVEGKVDGAEVPFVIEVHDQLLEYLEFSLTTEPTECPIDIVAEAFSCVALQYWMPPERIVDNINWAAGELGLLQSREWIKNEGREGILRSVAFVDELMNLHVVFFIQFREHREGYSDYTVIVASTGLPTE